MRLSVSSGFTSDDFLFAGNSVFVEEMHQQYLKNPNSVDESWRNFFSNYTDSTGQMRPDWDGFARVLGMVSEVPDDSPSKSKKPGDNGEYLNLLAKKILRNYRTRAHSLTHLDPLGIEVLKDKKDVGLDLESFGVNDATLAQNVKTKFGNHKLADLIRLLDDVYLGRIGIECSHLQEIQEIEFLYNLFEDTHFSGFNKQEKVSMLENLMAATSMENYLHVKFPGAKRFSVEGGEATIAALEDSIEFLAKNGSKEAVIGMAHRGRLNTLTRVMGKPYRAIFAEFKGASAFPDDLGISGDVKYHMGYKSIRKIENNEIELELLPNPSHLEAVNPVVAGRVRAAQDNMGDASREKSVAILIHGDAAFCGQGIVAESLAMSYLKPYETGGVLHFVINNQVGFTANAKDGRVGRYSTEIAKMAGSPILHANGDDVESVIRATRIALEYRKLFKKDAVIEIMCYRKYGHNEGDEPFYTQPNMYRIIRQKQNPADIYASKLVAENTISEQDYTNMQKDFKAKLDKEFDASEKYKVEAHKFTGHWKGFDRFGKEADTSVAKKKLVDLGTKLCEVPSDFPVNPKVSKLLESRKADLKDSKPIDWATGEKLAFASILNDGVGIRITGQDSGRGTFSHRHSVLHHQETRKQYVPLENINPNAKYDVADSNLSEYGVLGFEYGYSIYNPKQLVIWEAQFGDFANGGQIMFDQFISSGETKWMQMSGLVCLLPHGYEGQGPEHSSARLERFLQLAAEDNMIVANPTNPASLFHLLRRQVTGNVRKPLIIMSPKSLLRHKLAVSNLSDLDKGSKFNAVLDDELVDAKKAKRIIFCSGKVYYDLFQARQEKKIKDIAIVRLEQLYPFPEEEVQKILSKYSNAKDIVWCQEEPENMGSWFFIQPRFMEILTEKHEFSYIGRKASASPATGYASHHKQEQAEIIENCLG